MEREEQANPLNKPKINNSNPMTNKLLALNENYKLAEAQLTNTYSVKQNELEATKTDIKNHIEQNINGKITEMKAICEKRVINIKMSNPNASIDEINKLTNNMECEFLIYQKETMNKLSTEHESVKSCKIIKEESNKEMAKLYEYHCSEIDKLEKESTETRSNEKEAKSYLSEIGRLEDLYTVPSYGI